MAVPLCLCLGDLLVGADQHIWAIVLVCAAVSSIAGFAFSALAGSLLFHVTQDTIYALQVMLIASVALQSYSVWKLRRSIELRSLAPYFVGGVSTILPGIYLLLNTPTAIYFLGLGAFLIAYALFMLMRPPLRLRRNHLLCRIAMGALGGLTGATAAFPGAFVTIWCSAHEWDKERQRAIYQPFILGMQLLTLAVLAAFRPWQALELDLITYVPPALIGAHIGLGIFHQLSSAQFNRIVGGLLLLAGIALSLKAM